MRRSVKASSGTVHARIERPTPATGADPESDSVPRTARPSSSRLATRAAHPWTALTSPGASSGRHPRMGTTPGATSSRPAKNRSMSALLRGTSGSPDRTLIRGSYHPRIEVGGRRDDRDVAARRQPVDDATNAVVRTRRRRMLWMIPISSTPMGLGCRASWGRSGCRRIPSGARRSAVRKRSRPRRALAAGHARERARSGRCRRRPPGTSGCDRLGDLVHVGRGRDAGADVEELADPGLGDEVPRPRPSRSRWARTMIGSAGTRAMSWRRPRGRPRSCPCRRAGSRTPVRTDGHAECRSQRSSDRGR